MTIFFARLERFENNIACIEGETQLSYRALQQRIELRKSEIITSLSLASKSNVKCLIGIVPNNSISTLVNYLAALQLKHAVIFVSDNDIKQANSMGLIAHFKPDIVLQCEHIVTFNGTMLDVGKQPQHIIHHDVAVLLSTSGSTGECKQVVLSYANLVANCQSICAYLPILPSDVTITTLPFQYSYGLSIIHTHLASGAAIVMNEWSVMQREFWQSFDTYQVSSFGGVPHTYDMLLRLKFTQKTLPNLRYFTQAGGKLGANKVTMLAEFAMQQNAEFYVMYGQTEASARMSFVNPETLMSKANTIGKAIPGGQLRVIDELGLAIDQANQQGQLVFKGDNVMLAYARRRDDLSHFDPLTELHTGDIGYFDADGDFFITGRTKRIIKIFGERISLDQIEVLVHEFLTKVRPTNASELCQNAVIGDDKKMIVVVALDTLPSSIPASINESASTNDGEALKQDLKKLLHVSAGIHPSAVTIVTVDSMPVLENGKTNYGMLSALFMETSKACYSQQFDMLMDAQSYTLDKAQKQALLLPILETLHQHHLKHCSEYQRICSQSGSYFETIEALPFLAVRLFKYYKLSSITKSEVFRVLSSSGTTGQTPARILLDKATSARQSKTLVKVMQNFIGKQRLPMLVIDSEAVAKGASGFSARTAGIQGMAFFGRKPKYALNDDMQANWSVIDAFFSEHKNTPVLIFGFTFMVWQHFVKALKSTGRVYTTNNAVLVHSGGWKKLEAEKVENVTFKSTLETHLLNVRTHNFYGMAEQVGSVFVECEHGYLHAPNMADIVIRNPYDLSVQTHKEEGIIQVLSAIPTSYPGHSILTEDRGRILGEDDCECGRKGKYFEVLGRLPKVEVRGCSDTHEPD